MFDKIRRTIRGIALGVILAMAPVGFVAAWIGVPAILLSTVGCQTGNGVYNPATGVYDTDAKADPIVVNAQRARSIALETFDAFMMVERKNEAALLKLNPKIHTVADEVRTHGKQWLNDLTAAITAYQSNRNADNKATLITALAVIQSAISSSQSYIAEAQKVK